MGTSARIVIAGAHSGVGKTSLTLGLIALLRRRGLKVQTFKVGPDYLDPTYLALASGRPCYNLDGWMTGHDYVKRLFCQKMVDCDIAVIEGVMGLFDGADAATDEGSTAQIAKWLDAPVLLVLGAHGMARSLAAMAMGYARFDADVRIAGILANQCGSENHVRILRESLIGSGTPLLGAVPRGSIPSLSSRRLGLVSARPNLVSPETLNQLADSMASALATDEILRIARHAPPISCGPIDELVAPRRFRLGLANDDAFHFYYPDNLQALERAGCELVSFSPLSDSALPERLDGLYLGGGYPEEYAAALSGNHGMLEQIRRFPRLIYAECGGLMYLSEGIETCDCERYPQAGRLPSWVKVKTNRKALGYVEVTLAKSTCWGLPGQTLRGHEYHYSELMRQPDWNTAYIARQRSSGKISPEGFLRGSVLASYIHLHFASRPEALRSFIRCLEEQ
ncbi:MAG: cobyrinate a,c-diamide synthase [Acidobacteriota bacterium]|jgi:cobyrinic acid a,c-diamide synthase|nr:cobyrinate a,c-diamide synthase [Acidobacteriota bacterium]